MVHTAAMLGACRQYFKDNTLAHKRAQLITRHSQDFPDNGRTKNYLQRRVVHKIIDVVNDYYKFWNGAPDYADCSHR